MRGLATIAFALPGALGARLACPDRKVLAVMGDAGFLMNSQEIETAVREQIPLVVLVWVDEAYGLIKWKMDLELGHHLDVDFGNPDFVTYTHSFGTKGYRIEQADDRCRGCAAPWRRVGSRSPRLPEHGGSTRCDTA